MSYIVKLYLVLYDNEDAIVLVFSMDGFRVMKLDEVVRQIDILITCTGQSVSQSVSQFNIFSMSSTTCSLDILLGHQPRPLCSG